MKKTILFGLVTSGLLLSQASNAGEWAVGGLIGQSSIDEFCDGLSGCDDSDTAFGINVSYNFNKAWGIEAGYTDFGTFDADGDITDLGVFSPAGGTFDVSADLTTLHLAGTGTYNFNDAWSITGRLGVATADLDSRVSVDLFGFGEESVSDDDSETGVFAGASINYNFNGNLQAQLRYDNFDGDADVFALGLRYSFGR